MEQLINYTPSSRQGRDDELISAFLIYARTPADRSCEAGHFILTIHHRG